MMRVCFGRLVSARRILVLCILIFSQDSQTIADYENVNFAEYLLQTFLVYNELMTIYIPQEKTKNKFAV